MKVRKIVTGMNHSIQNVYHQNIIQFLGILVDKQLKCIGYVMPYMSMGSLKDGQIAMEVTDAAKTEILSKGLDPAYGARPLRRAIQRMVEDVVTTGGSALKAIERCRAEKLEVVACLALVDRLEGGREAIEATGVPLVSLFTRKDFIP